MNIINVQKTEKIRLRIINERQNTKIYECDLEELLEKYINLFIKNTEDNYSSPMVLYNGNSFFGDELKRPIKEIIKPKDKMEKIMILLLCQNDNFDPHDQEKIIINLLIESVEKTELNGIKGETIKDIINKSSIIKIDLKWCIFKYKDNEIDINKKFDDIANEEDKKNLRIIITVNYTIPLVVNFVNKSKKKSKIFQCQLKHQVGNLADEYFMKYHLNRNDYDLFYENKILRYYEIFYEFILKGKNQSCLINEALNSTENIFISTDNPDKTDANMENKKKICEIPTSVFPAYKTDDKKLEIEIKVIKKSCCVRFIIKICEKCEACCVNCDKCCVKCKYCLKGVRKHCFEIICYIIAFIILFFVCGGFFLFMLI